MLFSEISPHIRYARYEKLNKDFLFHESIPLDARLFYTVSGYGKIKVKSKEYRMMPYSLLLINSGVPYHISPPEEAVTYIALNFDYTQSAADHRLPIPPIQREKFKSEFLLDPISFDDTTMLSEVAYIQEIPSVKQRLTEIVKEYTQKLLYYEQKSSHMLAECLADSLRVLALGSTDREAESVALILSYVHEHFDHPLTNIALGEIFSYHPNYINQLIKGATGMSLHQYVIHLRMMQAVRLLENMPLPIAEIALRCGFCDLAYFSQYFKKYFGISPSKYRNA